MRAARCLAVSVLAALSSAFAILPQAEPEAVLACAASARPDPICLAPGLDAASLARLRTAGGARPVPFRAPLWTAREREYRLVGAGRALHVTLARRGTGPWQVTRASFVPAPARDLAVAHVGQLEFRTRPGHEVREAPGRVEVLDRGGPGATTVLHARRVARDPAGPSDEAAYVRALPSLHPEALRPVGGGPFGEGPLGDGAWTVEGEVATRDGRAWRVLVRGEGGSRPVYVLPRGGAVWVVQGDAAHGPLLDATVPTLRVRP